MSHRVHEVTTGVRGARGGDPDRARPRDQDDLQCEVLSESVKSLVPALKPGETAWLTKAASYYLTLKSTKPSRANNGEFIEGEHKHAHLRFDVPFITSDPETNELLKKHRAYGTLFWTAEDQVERDRREDINKVLTAIKTIEKLPADVKAMVASELKDLNLTEFPKDSLQ